MYARGVSEFRYRQHRIENGPLIRYPHGRVGAGCCLAGYRPYRGTICVGKQHQCAIALAGAVRSTLGPRGSDKMLVDENGEIVVTNDGVTVLETAKVEHPTANLLIATSSAQDRIARDGTTTSVLLTAELLRNALELSRIGVHPTIIMNGYRIAVEESLTQLEEISRDASDDDLIATTATTMAGKDRYRLG